MARTDKRKIERITKAEQGPLARRRLRPPQHLHVDLAMYESYDKETDQLLGFTKISEIGFSVADVVARAREYATAKQKRHPVKIAAIARCAEASHVAGMH